MVNYSYTVLKKIPIQIKMLEGNMNFRGSKMRRCEKASLLKVSFSFYGGIWGIGVRRVAVPVITKGNEQKKGGKF